jgi:protein-S-isoprenylcysteine O-methyltransferase Ste14
MSTSPSLQSAPIPTKRLDPLQVFAALVYLFGSMVLMFWAAGTINWWQGWLYTILGISGSIISRALALRIHPDLLMERGTAARQANVKPWDRWLVPAVAILGPILITITAGFDYRFGWLPELPDWTMWLGLGVFLVGYVLSIWAFVVNRFFSAYVRIQSDRGHYVVEQGPYALLRHPGYAAGILVDLGVPLILGSLWAFIPALLTCGLIVLRTALEDKTLQTELPGYVEYTRRTRYRLLPGVW